MKTLDIYEIESLKRYYRSAKDLFFLEAATGETIIFSFLGVCFRKDANGEIFKIEKMKPASKTKLPNDIKLF